MGNLILCSRQPVERPYYVAGLGIHLFSAEELSYFLYNHVLLIGEDFPDERLFDFLRQLELTRLEERVRRMREQSGIYEIVYVMLQELRYYSNAELFAFRKQIDALSRMTAAERLKARGDYLFDREQYYSALRVYNQILTGEGIKKQEDEFCARIWYNKGACFARMENYPDAAECLKEAYVLSRDEAILEKMFALSELLGEQEAEKEWEALVSEEKMAEYRSNLMSRRELAGYQGKALEAAALADKPEPERSEGYLELLFRWKEEYRKNQTT